MTASETANPFASNLIEVIAGQEQKSLHAHAAVLCRSDKLKALIEGEWADSRKIKLSDWDEETISRLLDWLYSGNYSFPFPQTQFTPRDDTSKGLSIILARDQHLNFEEWKKDTKAGTEIKKHGTSYYPTLMAHAKIYAIANYMLLPELKKYAFEQAKTILFFLGELKAETPPVEDLGPVARYVYANTATLANSEEPLRFLLNAFLAINFVNWKGKAVDDLMDEGGDLAVDMALRVREQLVEAINSKWNLEDEMNALSTKLDDLFSEVDAFSAG